MELLVVAQPFVNWMDRPFSFRICSTASTTTDCQSLKRSKHFLTLSNATCPYKSVPRSGAAWLYVVGTTGSLACLTAVRGGCCNYWTIMMEMVRIFSGIHCYIMFSLYLSPCLAVSTPVQAITVRKKIPEVGLLLTLVNPTFFRLVMKKTAASS